MKNLNLNTPNHRSFARIMVFTMALSLIFALSSCYSHHPKESKGVAVVSSTAMAAPTSQTTTVRVIIQNGTYIPQTLTITKGEKVTWINKDSGNHTVISGTDGKPTGLFNSGDIGPNQMFSHVFDSTGTYPYYCKYLPSKMTGTVIVK